MDQRRLLAELERRQRRRLLFIQYADPYDHSKPFGGNNVGAYNWQIEFHDAGIDHPERLLMAANRVGKTRTGAAEVAIHLTGLYPHWWKGRVFDGPTKWWCGSETNEASRDIVQTALLGPSGQWGTGWIPGDCLEGRPALRQAGISEVVDNIFVKHTSGGLSQATLKTYEQGVKVWQGVSVDGVWFDEEPKMEIYTEGLTRTLDRKGIVMMTRTPLSGPTEVVRHFMEGHQRAKSGIYLKNASWDDAPHLDDDEKARLTASFPEYERDTRTGGTPMMGTGMVFPIADDRITCDPVEIKPWWRLINGLDFGIDHPAAGAFCALDPEGEGTFYVYDCYRARNETAIYHAAAMKKHGDWIPNAWPHDGLDRDKGSGIALKDLYRRAGAYMLREHAHYPDERGNHVDPGLIEMYEWMRLGRFKVFRTLGQWMEEKRMYHREDGKVIKKNDDLLSATRYAFIMRRYARTKPTASEIGSMSPVSPIVGRKRWLRNDG